MLLHINILYKRAKSIFGDISEIIRNSVLISSQNSFNNYFVLFENFLQIHNMF